MMRLLKCQVCQYYLKSDPTGKVPLLLQFPLGQGGCLTEPESKANDSSLLAIDKDKNW